MLRNKKNKQKHEEQKGNININKDLKLLREEFEKRNIGNRMHPKTSYGKRNISKYFSNNNKNDIEEKNKKLDFELDKYVKIISLKNQQHNNFVYKNRNITRNNPGYLYFKEILNMSKTVQNKRRISAEKIISPKYTFNEKQIGQKQKSYSNIFYKNTGPLKNYINLNNPYMPFWITKIIIHRNRNRNRNIIRNGRTTFIERNNPKYDLFSKTTNAFHPMKNRTLELRDKIRRNNLNNDYPIIFKKMKKLQKKKYSQNSVDSLKNIMSIKKINLNHNQKEKEKKEMFKDDDDIKISPVQEKQFYQIQKNFFQTRKEIIEEPEYLEEDN